MSSETMPAPAGLEEEPRFEAPALLKIVWADPGHAAEHMALWALKYFGPRATTAAAKLRAAHPDADDEELERIAIERGTHRAMAEGAFVGGPFIVLVPFAFVAALLAQSHMMLELAALTGRSAEDQARASDLLVLQGAFATTAEANESLATVKRDTTGRERISKGSRISVVMRMAYVLGVLGPGAGGSKLVQALRWALVSAVFVVGLVLPLVWVPYLAYSYRGSTIRLGRRAVEYYAQADGADTGVVVTRAPGGVSVGGTVALARTLLVVAIPVIAGLVALLTGVKLVGNEVVTAGVLLLVVSLLATLGWVGYRVWRRRRSRSTA